MIKCGKVKMFKERASKGGYLNIITLENLGEVVVTKEQYREVSMGDIVSLSVDNAGNYIILGVINRSKIDLMESKYVTINWMSDERN